jgi:hypothetical protein
MKFSLTTKLAAATGLTALLLGGLVPPIAQADPIANGTKSIYGQLVGGGSDTTQDVMNGLQIAIGRVSSNGDWKLASYDANLADSTIQVKADGGASICRPNGSGNGLKALNVAIGADDSEACTPFSGSASVWNSDAAAGTSVIGQFQYSRSSSGPSPTVTEGVVAYVPFARDAVGYAVSDDSVMPDLTVGTSTDAADSDGVTPSSLWAIYNCAATRIITVDGDLDGSETFLVNDSYTEGSDESSTRIRAYLPQSGSGTADFWQGKSGAKFGIGSTVANCVERKAFLDGDAGDDDGGNNTFTSGADYTGISVQEHSGQAVQGNPGAITPFSIPKWIAMAKAIPGVTDVRYDAVIGTLNGAAPTSGSGSDLVINPDYIADASYVTRTVYNVVPYRTVTDPTSLEYAMFNGRTSLICSNEAAIENYGFATLTATSGINSCGNTSQRAVTGSTASVDTATATLDNDYSVVDFEVTGFDSNGDAGAEVYVLATNANDATDSFYVNEADPALIEAGETDAAFTLPYADLPNGNWDLGLVIVPNLPGILNISTATDLVTKSGVTTRIAATVTGKVKKFGKAVVTVTAGSSTPTGRVNIYKGNSDAGQLVGTGVLTDGTLTITNVSKQKKKGNVKLFVVYEGDGSHAASTKSVTWKVK